jgi:hypothetical protein
MRREYKVYFVITAFSIKELVPGQHIGMFENNYLLGQVISSRINVHGLTIG